MSANRQTMTTLYSDSDEMRSHQVRIVLAEKGVMVDVIQIDRNHPNEDLAELNPYNTLPTLVDRELVLYQAPVIMEYLDERFPHPPLLPVYPVARAKSRLMMRRIEQDWYTLADCIEADPYTEKADAARLELKQSLTVLAPVFAQMPYFLSDEFTLVDACLAPLFWRLEKYGIDLTTNKANQSIIDYTQRVFARDSFQVSLTEEEREIQETADVI